MTMVVNFIDVLYKENKAFPVYFIKRTQYAKPVQVHCLLNILPDLHMKTWLRVFVTACRTTIELVSEIHWADFNLVAYCGRSFRHCQHE